MKGWLHHIDLTVADLAASTRFYARLLPLLSFRRLADAPEGPIWRGSRVEVGLQQARPGRARPHDRYSPGLHHLAFGAPSREAVMRVYRALVGLGAVILDPPSVYEDYAPGYYAVFFADPDGIKLEYVHAPSRNRKRATPTKAERRSPGPASPRRIP